MKRGLLCVPIIFILRNNYKENLVISKKSNNILPRSSILQVYKELVDRKNNFFSSKGLLKCLIAKFNKIIIKFDNVLIKERNYINTPDNYKVHFENNKLYYSRNGINVLVDSASEFNKYFGINILDEVRDSEVKKIRMRRNKFSYIIIDLKKNLYVLPASKEILRQIFSNNETIIVTEKVIVENGVIIYTDAKSDRYKINTNSVVENKKKEIDNIVLENKIELPSRFNFNTPNLN